MPLAFKEIDLKNKEIFKNANPMMIVTLKGFNKSFGLLKKMREGLEKENVKTIILVFDKTNQSDDIENAPFKIYTSTDDVMLTIKQYEHLLTKKK